ncbi:LacI family DNA-binding transcriptional regulator [Cognatishimia sp. MH4019]|uniref:LacI family DNA-binding transcriptional regulator n=1 Tax=Cognatishimia sp. MH4019 TaxID=2854030 RepID=UPI001CD38D93|nr:substrate-binding domain-containing protein [Cognatishimia sp. MH4019]
MNLRELAQNLGLSQTTVSRALNGYPEVNEATRARVVQAAEQHNYRPNTRAKGLATGRAMAIGHVIPMSKQHEMVNPVFGDFIAGAGETYSRNGYDMVLSLVEDGQEEKTYRDLRGKGAVDGLIVHGPKSGDARIAMLDDLGVPFVVHGRASAVTTPYAWLDVNNRKAFQRATDFLLDLGHRRIALINGLEELDFASRRRAGYEEALTARGLPVTPDYLHSDEMTERYGYDTVRHLLDSDAAPTAFLVSSMITAIGVRRAIEERGLRMGRDISVITHDDALSYFKNGEEAPIFTATCSSVREAGRQAAQMLLERIANPHLPPPNRLLEAQLVVGGSTGPAPTSRTD